MGGDVGVVWSWCGGAGRRLVCRWQGPSGCSSGLDAAALMSDECRAVYARADVYLLGTIGGQLWGGRCHDGSVWLCRRPALRGGCACWWVDWSKPALLVCMAVAHGMLMRWLCWWSCPCDGCSSASVRPRDWAAWTPGHPSTAAGDPCDQLRATVRPHHLRARWAHHRAGLLPWADGCRQRPEPAAERAWSQEGGVIERAQRWRARRGSGRRCRMQRSRHHHRHQHCWPSAPWQCHIDRESVAGRCARAWWGWWWWCEGAGSRSAVADDGGEVGLGPCCMGCVQDIHQGHVGRRSSSDWVSDPAGCLLQHR
jgi:hypothetical protein